jgi:hypothetical protein
MIHHCLRNHMTEFWICLFFIRKLDRFTNRAISFFSVSLRSPQKKTYSPVCRPVSSNKTSKSKSPGLYFTNNGVFSHYLRSPIHSLGCIGRKFGRTIFERTTSSLQLSIFLSMIDLLCHPQINHWIIL